MLQLAGINGLLYYRAKQSENVTMDGTAWVGIRDTENWGKILYNNSSGTNGTVTLSESVANFNYIDIYFKTNDETVTCDSVRIYQAGGKNASLMGSQPSAVDLTAYIKLKTISIGDTTISTFKYSEVGLRTNGTFSVYESNYIYITQVVGYR